MNINKNILFGALLIGASFLVACEKNELEYVEQNVPPVVYLAGAPNGTWHLNGRNVRVDNGNKTITAAFGVHRSGIQEKGSYSVDVTVNTNNLPEGTIPLQPSDYTFYGAGGAPVGKVEVSAGETSAPLYLSIAKEVLDANAGNVLALNVQISNPGGSYALSEALSSITIVINADLFAEQLVEVTSRYINNPGGASPFERSDAGGNRFGILKDWTVNDVVKNIAGNTLGGFDSYQGGYYMSMERWDTPEIPNGKIYQTVSLPAGRYIFEVDFESTVITNEAYLIVAEGKTLPDVADINSAIKYSPYSTPAFEFDLAEETEVSIGILANLINNYQGFRARGVKLLKYESVFE